MIDKCSSFSLEPLYAQAVVGRWHLLQGRVFPSPLVLFEITSQSCPETRLVFEFRPNGIDSQDWPSQRLGKSEGAYIVILVQHKEVLLVSIGVETCWLSGDSEDLGMSIFLSLYKTMLVNLRATTTVWKASECVYRKFQLFLFSLFIFHVSVYVACLCVCMQIGTYVCVCALVCTCLCMQRPKTNAKNSSLSRLTPWSSVPQPNTELDSMACLLKQQALGVLVCTFWD